MSDPRTAQAIPPVFVLSTGRCGSTMVSNLLNLHPRILSLSELYSFTGLTAFAGKRRSGEWMWDLLSQQRNHTRLMLQGNYEELLYPFDTPGARFTRADVPPIMCATIPHLTPDHDAFFDEIEPAVRSLPTQSPSQQYRDIFDWLCSRFGRVAWVERSGTSLLSASVLLKHFPDARVIHVYRDGHDVALSMSRHYLFRVLVASLTGLRMGSVDMLNLIRHDWIWEHLESGISYNPLSREGIQDPYPTYDRLREKDPVHRLRLTNAWILTRYEDVDRVMRGHGQFSRDDPNEVPFARGEEYKSMLRMDPPDHTRIRSLVSKAFTPRAVADLGQTIQAIVDDHLDRVAGKRQFDLLTALAYPLPLFTSGALLGVPAEDVDKFGRWSTEGANAFIPHLSEQEKRRIRNASEEAFQYTERQIELRHREPRDDIITALIAAEEAGDRLTREELVTTLSLLMVAGNDMSKNLIGNGMLALLKNPEQLETLRRNPEMTDSAIHELLRYDSPIRLGARFAPADTEIGGRRIRAGQTVICGIGAANRDPSVLPDPHVLDISREQRSHISFGRGVHHCLGAQLVMLQARIAFTSLIERFPDIILAREPKYRERHVIQRGLQELWVDVGH